jgi:DNA-binding CsgD family transcriptional regulator
MLAAIFGREHELRTLEEFIVRSRSGPSGVVIAGEAGIGKTILWQQIVERAAAGGATVLACRSVEAEASLAFTGLSDLLADRAEEILGELSGPRRRALEVALLLEEPDAKAPDPRALGMAFLDALRHDAAAGAVLVAVDDLQWLDPSSAGVLGFAFRRLRSEPVGLLATVRSGSERSVPLDRDSVDWLQLEPFSLAALHHLLRDRLGLELTRSELSRLHGATAGNPYFALEVGRELARLELRPAPGLPLPMPATLHELLGRRLASFGDEVRSVLLSTAVLARPTVEVLSAAHGAAATRAIEEAARAAVVELDESRVRFTHPLLATVCYREAPARARRAAHRALAAIVPEVEEQARHLALAAEAPDDLVATTLDRAAELASARGGTASAAELWGLAAKLTPGDAASAKRRRKFRAADAHRLAGDRARAATMLEELLSDASPGAERADVLFGLASTRRMSLPAMAALCEGALEELVDDDDRAARISIFLSWIRVSQGDVRAALAVARTALAHAERSGDDMLVARAIGRASMAETWRARITPGLVERGVELEGRLGRSLEFHESPSVALERRLICQGKLDLARPLLERIEAGAAEHGDEGTRGHALVHFVLLEWYAGRWQAALRHADSALELAEQIADDTLLGLVLNVRALAELYLGRVDEARRSLARSTAIAEEASDTLVPLWNRAVLGATELALGNPGAAAEHLRDLPARLTELGWLDPADHIWPDTIEALAALGELERARSYLEQLEELGRRLDSRWVRANACRCRGLLAAAEGDAEAAYRAFEQGLAEHERLAAPFERARTLLALGSVRRRARQKRAAREALEQALAVFEELGARLWVERAREELGRIGGRVAGRLLTAAERRVAVLAAEGRSNNEIAASLFVTPHTVETHLSSVYRKLGIRSRAGLAHAAAAEASEAAADKD